MFAGLRRGTGSRLPDYGERLRRRLREDVAAGAAGLGELTDKGLGLVRVRRPPYFIDDARFDPLWDEAGKLGVPVFVHIAEPAAFYEPPDESNELRRSANWSLYGKGTPGLRGHAREVRARAGSAIGGRASSSVHAFNLANDLGAVGALLDRHPERAGRLRRAHVGAGPPAVHRPPLLREVPGPDPVRHGQRSRARHVPRPRAPAGDRGRVVLAARTRNGGAATG